MLKATRGPYAKTAQRRAAMARAALDVVMQLGHRDLTAAEVARRAGVSERSLFNHFPTRDHLLVGALQSSVAEAGESFGPSGPDVADPADDVLGQLVAHDLERPNLMRLSSYLVGEASRGEGPVFEFMESHIAKAVAGLAFLVRQQQKRGLAHPDLDVDVVARRFFCLWQGLQQVWLVSPTFDLGGEVRATFRQLSGQAAMEAKQAIDDLVAGL